MAGSPTRAVRLIAIGEEPKADQLNQEQVAAYRAVQSASNVAKIDLAVLQRRNAAMEAASRIYAYGNFR